MSRLRATWNIPPPREPMPTHRSRGGGKPRLEMPRKASRHITQRAAIPFIAWLKAIRHLDSRIVSQAEVFRRIEGIPHLRALGTEGIAGFQEQVACRDVADAGREGTDPI